MDTLVIIDIVIFSITFLVAILCHDDEEIAAYCSVLLTVCLLFFIIYGIVGTQSVKIIDPKQVEMQMFSDRLIVIADGTMETFTDYKIVSTFDTGRVFLEVETKNIGWDAPPKVIYHHRY